MSFKATLHIFTKTYSLLDLKYNINQQTDSNGRPTRRALGGTINLKLASTKDDTGLYEAMFSPTQSIEGSIRVYKRDGLSKSFDIEFANAYIVGLNEHFNAISNQPLQMDLTISAQILRIRNTVFELPANPSNPFEGEDTPLTERERTQEDPQIISCRYTDLEGNEIDELYEDKLILEVETENCVGKVVDIDLSDEDYNFKHRGKELPNDVLEGLKITANLQKVELEVYFDED